MKKSYINLLSVTLFILAFTAMFFNANAQPPQGMNYQAIVRDASGSVLPNQTVSLRISITNGNGGSVLYRETFNSITANMFGLINLNIGNGTPVIGTFSNINWAGVTAWMQVDMDVTGGTTYSSMGTSQLLSVPYSLYAISSGNANGTTNYVSKFTSGNTLGNSSIFDNGYVGIGTATPANKFEIQNTGTEYSIYVNKTNLVESVVLNKDAVSSSTADVYMTYNGMAATLESHSTGSGAAGYFDGGASGNAIYATGTLAGPVSSFYSGGTGAAVDINSAGFNASTHSTGYLYGSASIYSYATYPAAVKGTYTGTGGNDGSGILGIATSPSADYGVGVTGTGNWYGVAGIGNTGAIAGVGAFDNGATYALYAIGTSYFNGNIAGAGTFSYTSDAKLKKNIRSIDNALSVINQLKPSTYEFRTGEFGAMKLSEGKHYGVIAQDLQQVLPELVNQSKFVDPDKKGTSVDYLSVNYNELIPILIKAVQEQQTQITKLQSEIERLSHK